MTAWRRAIRWLMLALACVALGAVAVPARAQAQQDVAAQVEVLARKAERARQSQTIRSPAVRPRLPRDPRAPTRLFPRRPGSLHLPAPPGRLYLTHRALLR